MFEEDRILRGVLQSSRPDAICGKAGVPMSDRIIIGIVSFCLAVTGVDSVEYVHDDDDIGERPKETER